MSSNASFTEVDVSCQGCQDPFSVKV